MADDDGYPSRSVVNEILAERVRQTRAEGWTPEHDDAHANGELARAAACYAHVAAMRDTNRAIEIDNASRGTHADAIVIARSWPWQWTWWKPKDRRRDLVRAAALIVAEIERLDRAARKAA